MRKARLPGWAWVLFICAELLGSAVTVSALEEGEVTGRIERLNAEFLRDYEKLDYGDRGNWAEWGKGLRSLGWIVVQGDSGEPKDHLLLVIDSRTQVLLQDSRGGRFEDLEPSSRIRARYRMGWDALHALEVRRLEE